MRVTSGGNDGDLMSRSASQQRSCGVSRPNTEYGTAARPDDRIEFHGVGIEDARDRDASSSDPKSTSVSPSKTLWV
jgi:hypothetical protein